MPKPTAPTAEELSVYAGQNELLAAYYRAEAALCENTAREAAAGVLHETDEASRLNDAVVDAAAALPESLRHVAEV